MKTPTVKYDESKFKELLLYVASRLAGDPSYGSIKLNKVLFFSDFFHYAAYGTAITGVEYVKHPLGPAPKGIVEMQQRLIENGEADLAILYRGTKGQKLLFAKREPDLSKFKGTEIAQVERVIEALCDHTAEQVSDLSHSLLGWKVSRDRAVIPYFSVFLYDGPALESDLLTAKELENRFSGELDRRGVAAA